MTADKHMKAQDVFNRTNFLFGQKVTFEQAFPEIEEISVTVKESGYGVIQGLEISKYTRVPGEYINCSNPSCYNGGVRVGDLIRAMVREKRTYLEKSASCQGYEGSPKGRRRYRSCINSFRITIDIKYREQKPDN